MEKLIDILKDVPAVEIPINVLMAYKNKAVISTDANDRYKLLLEDCYNDELPAPWTKCMIFVKYENNKVHWFTREAHEYSDRRYANLEDDNHVICSGVPYLKHPLYRGESLKSLKERYKDVYVSLWHNFAMDTFGTR